jgi:membrane dipeptidase
MTTSHSDRVGSQAPGRSLPYVDHRQSPAAWARSLGISTHAVELYLDSHVLDLHNDLYVPARLYGYDVFRAHRPWFLGARYTGHSDFPRLRQARLTGVSLDIATNPARRGSRRLEVALANIARVQADVARHPTELRIVRTHAEYLAARRDDVLACFIGIQGGQAFQFSRDSLERIPDVVHRVTLVHLTNSRIGSTSSPLGPDRGGLTPRGIELVEVMNARRVLVDLAHINRAGFLHAADVHDKTQPLICTHTGVNGVHRHWRNIDDDQIRLVTETGGVVGIMFHGGFLDGTNWGYCPPERVIAHMEHVISIAGEGAVAIGTDYDGMVIPPARLHEVTQLPVLVQLMLDRSWSEDRIRGALGVNALRTLERIRP